MRVIITCSCGSVRNKINDLYQLRFREDYNKDHVMPDVHSGCGPISRLADSLPDGNAKKYIAPIANKHKKFAYCFDIDDNGDLLLSVNLLTGAHIV